MGAVSRFYVTTPIYYVNDVPHIGHAYTTVAGDVLTRWHRLLGDEVFFLTGTDEHGLKIQRAAEAKGLEPAELVSRPSPAMFREEWDSLDIAYDDFIRTTEPRHHVAVKDFLQTHLRRGRHRARHLRRPLLRLVRGSITPRTSSIDGNCPIHDRPVEHVTEENYFFKLSRYEDRLLEYYAEHPEAVQPESRRNEVLGFIRSGLQRLLDEPHVDHVGRAAAVGREARRVRVGRRAVQLLHRGRLRHRPAIASTKCWPVDYHLIGKDILRFTRRVLARDVDVGRARRRRSACSRTAGCS